MLEIEKKAHQEVQDLLVAQQLNNEFNNVKIGGGKTLLHSLLPRLLEMGNIGEHLHHLLVLEERALRDMIVIGNQQLLDFEDNLHNMLIMVHSMVVVQMLTIILMISWLCNKIHIFNNM